MNSKNTPRIKMLFQHGQKKFKPHNNGKKDVMKLSNRVDEIVIQLERSKKKQLLIMVLLLKS